MICCADYCAARQNWFLLMGRPLTRLTTPTQGGISAGRVPDERLPGWGFVPRTTLTFVSSQWTCQNISLRYFCSGRRWLSVFKTNAPTVALDVLATFAYSSRLRTCSTPSPRASSSPVAILTRSAPRCFNSLSATCLPNSAILTPRSRRATYQKLPRLNSRLGGRAFRAIWHTHYLLPTTEEGIPGLSTSAGAAPAALVHGRYGSSRGCRCRTPPLSAGNADR